MTGKTHHLFTQKGLYTMKNTMKYALFGAVLALVTPAHAAAPDCYKVSTAVKKAVAANPENVLELVATQVAQNESCACEIVKAAIVASDADKKLVADIVSAAVTSAPEKVRIIGQCAVAVAPDALAEVQAVVTKFGANAGDGYSAKGGSAKGGKEVVVPPVASNPLDFPGSGPEGPTPGGPGGFPLFPPGLQPPVVTPPSSTSEDEQIMDKMDYLIPR
ncbi:hypothetical protein JO972_03790 [Verrucomicrobiaceae bacterium 5K15]|uniref:Uncharacterized protein n=2 Tax=Oceaniferula flava TaxID=2800421 RepID=A0AAE2SAW7_9BACT|nr:hypothetical protein [Oceaniferula flavus]MBM1135368.1 hypothetical protein [Oceaniferula flavus]